MRPPCRKQQLNSGAHRAFGELHLTDILLGEDDRAPARLDGTPTERRLIDQDELAHPVHLAHPWVVAHPPVLIEHPGEEKLGHGVDDARPTQSRRRSAADRLVFGPILQQAQSLDGAAGGAHAVPDVGPLEGRSGGAGGTGQNAVA